MSSQPGILQQEQNTGLAVLLTPTMAPCHPEQSVICGWPGLVPSVSLPHLPTCSKTDLYHPSDTLSPDPTVLDAPTLIPWHPHREAMYLGVGYLSPPHTDVNSCVTQEGTVPHL
jgi:hypothetical protein